MDLKWSPGIFLGNMMSSNEAIVGLPNGDVTRARGIARIRPDQRWDLALVNKLQGFPWLPSKGEDDSVLECMDNPHMYIDAEQRKLLEGELDVEESPIPRWLSGERSLPSLRITKGDLDHHGFTPGCPRCLDTQCGLKHITTNHTDECRSRIYKAMWRQGDANLSKWLRDHPDNQAKVGPSVAEARAQDLESPGHAPIPPRGDLVVVEDLDQKDFIDVVTLLVQHGVPPVQAKQCVTNVVKQ